LANAPKTELQNILKKAKIYLHTTVGEHFGISIAEAMASGCIPIVPDSGGMKEFVPRKYRYANTCEAADKITKALAEWSPYETIRMRRAVEKFGEESFRRSFAVSFEKFLADSKKK
jgi:alpha-1,2-mannosyltransferase